VSCFEADAKQTLMVSGHFSPDQLFNSFAATVGQRALFLGYRLISIGDQALLLHYRALLMCDRAILVRQQAKLLSGQTLLLQQ
jgi:hypothetical protein